jgi:farnesyl diphosphate synthase
MYFDRSINIKKKEFDLFYMKILQNQLSKDLLSKAMIYASMNGGKRIRPFLVSIFSELAKVKKRQSLRISTAIESIHSYSLIHDDLPSMDNDDFRRGKPSTHMRFNEATAILAGDALHDLAYEIVSNEKTSSDSNVRISLINRLSIATGSKGLAGGQSLDLIFENKKIDFKKIIKMYEMKTAALFSFSCVAPYILAKKNIKEIKFANDFGKLFGIIFQITDDIIDQDQDFKIIGKTPGKDKAQGKSTLLSIVSKEELKKYCLKKIKNLQNKNKNFFLDNPILSKLIYFNLDKIH